MSEATNGALSKSADGCAVAARWSDPAALKQHLMSAWIEAEAIIVTAEQLGKVPEVLMIFKAREMLREILHVLNAQPPESAPAVAGKAESERQRATETNDQAHARRRLRKTDYAE